MKFDFVIGNPPYQESDGGAKASASPVYQYFINNAKKISKNYEFIVPARWMTGGKGLDKFRYEMIHDNHIKILHDYANSKEIFPNVDIKGGVCIILWDKNYSGLCNCYRHNIDGVTKSTRTLYNGDDDIFIREPKLVSIKDKVDLTKGSIKDITSPRKPYGLSGDVFKDVKKYNLPNISDKPIKNGYQILGLDAKQKRTIKYVPKDYPFPKKTNLSKYKLFVTRNYGCGEIGEIPASPVLASPVLACTETFIEIGSFDNKEERNNLYKYFCTRFFRTLVGIRKQDQGASRDVYHYVPLQDFTNESDIDWSKSITEIDQQLYKKYGLSEEEIDFIETKITFMDDTIVINYDKEED